ncbi:hypothetical protein KEM55_000381 [Ascosphaera atra]|nr:hypothetical protein KEM55_000381 [Ascosphaera atra]
MSVQHDGRSQGYQPPELQRGGQPPSFLFSSPPEATPSRATPYPLDLVSSNLRFRSRSHSAVPSLSIPQTEQGGYFGSVGGNWSDRNPGFASVRENRSAPCSPNARRFSRHELPVAGEDGQYQNHFGNQSQKENMSATYSSRTLLSPPRKNAFKEPLTLDASSPSPISSLSSTSTNGTIPSPAAVKRALASTGSKPDRKKAGSKATSSKAGPTSAPLPIPTSAALADPTDPWDYTETERWGWFILLVTWIVFVIGIGSCFGVWSWAWDVGETPYAPPELEDDPTLPIVGYYPALIILTAVMAWLVNTAQFATLRGATSSNTSSSIAIVDAKMTPIPVPCGPVDSEYQRAVEHLDGACSAVGQNPEARDRLRQWLSDILCSELSHPYKRSLLKRYVENLRRFKPQHDLYIDIAESALVGFDSFKQGQYTFTTTQLTLIMGAISEAEIMLREDLAGAYEANEDFSAAAACLAKIPAVLLSDDTARARLYIRIVRDYLEEGDDVPAEGVLNRIKNLRPDAIKSNTSEGQTLRLHLTLSQAKVLDARRKFIEASIEYLNVSLNPIVDEQDRLQSLSTAVICAILSGAGPQRSRMLSRLYKDNRATQLTDIYGMLEKIYLDRLLSPAEVEAFAARLAPHQLAITSDGTTVLDRAVIEHNLLAASKIYTSVYVNDLGSNILNLKDDSNGTAGEKAEMYACRMLEEGRLKGCIDQIDGIIHFDMTKESGAPSALKMYDQNVRELAEEVDKVGTAIMKDYPVRLQMPILDF